MFEHLSACDFLKTLDPDWQMLIETVGPCTMVTHPEQEIYEALVRAISRQQIHGKAADAIMLRFLNLFANPAVFPEPEAILQLTPEQMRAVGFSSNKTLAIQGIAQAAVAQKIPTRHVAEQMSDETLITTLLPLRGVGRWTIEMILMFTLERPDVLPVDDFGVREGYRRWKKLSDAPTPKSLRILGNDWQPYRSTASWYLWQAARLPEQRSTT